MTGYSRLMRQTPFGTLVVEIRSTNHRYLEVGQRIPNGLAGLEGHVAQLVRRTIRRGRIDVNVTAQLSKEVSKRLVIDETLAHAYYERLLELKARFGLKGDVELGHLLGLPHLVGVVSDHTKSHALWPHVRRAIEQTLRQVLIMRRAEGQRLVKDIRVHLQVIRRRHGTIRKRLPRSIAQQKRALRQRLHGLVGRPAAWTSAKIQEALAFVKDVDIHEELVRLDSHLVHLKQALAGGRSGVGKKLDFIAQELMREANTIGAKANDASIARDVIEIKGAIEKIREQAQNLE